MGQGDRSQPANLLNDLLPRVKSNLVLVNSPQFSDNQSPCLGISLRTNIPGE
jgi:hypothetical protein